MLIDLIENNELNDKIAYIIGLTLYDISFYNYDNKNYIAGRIGHGSKKISDGSVSEIDLYNHYFILKDYLKEYYDKNFIIRRNKEYNPSNTSIGFSLLFETKNTNKINYENLLAKKLNEMISKDKNIQESLIRGIFDGRGSWDGANLLVVDVNINKNIIESTKNIVEALNFNSSSFYNPRGEGKPRLRLQLSDLLKIELFSPVRQRIISK